MIILDTPYKNNYYQCVNYDCERILTRIYKVRNNSQLITVPTDIPDLLHKPYLYYTIFKTKLYEKKNN